MSKNNSLTMVIGGASSGKSSFAESYVKSREGVLYYLATAQAYDDEMREKIILHQKDRENDGWHTMEEPHDLVDALTSLPDDANILLDCATMWLNNLIMAERDLDAETQKLIDFLAITPQKITVVTNEVGLGIVPENKLARAFRIAQGRLNARMAAQADLVVTVMAGLPLALKGDLP